MHHSYAHKGCFLDGECMEHTAKVFQLRWCSSYSAATMAEVPESPFQQSFLCLNGGNVVGMAPLTFGRYLLKRPLATTVL